MRNKFNHIKKVTIGILILIEKLNNDLNQNIANCKTNCSSMTQTKRGNLLDL